MSQMQLDSQRDVLLDELREQEYAAILQHARDTVGKSHEPLGSTDFLALEKDLS